MPTDLHLPADVAATPKPKPDWNAIWVAFQELGFAMAPVMDEAEPPSWAISLEFVMDVAIPDIEDRCAEAPDGD
jgi:hypothetical protein